jgi:C-terminal processing protease CtpA/Prc
MKYIIYLSSLFLCLCLNACGGDENEPQLEPEPEVETEPQADKDHSETIAWIEATMRKDYYWRDEIKKAGSLNYAADPEAFFASLLSSKDGKHGYHYSYIEKVSGSTRGSIRSENTYGFEFCALNFVDEKNKNNNMTGACILYVLPNSPASGKLKRGDWILDIDGKALTTKSLQTLFGGEKAKFTVTRWNPDANKFYRIDDVEIEAARAVEDNPVFHYDIFEKAGKKIGYLVYNHFTAGKEEPKGDATYDDKLRQLSAGFFNEVDEFVLDLRYNNGGLLSSAQLLCAIFTPFDKLEGRFGCLQYKDKDSGNRQYFTVSETLGNGKNLNLKRLYVLVSSMSASSSEAVINLLRPFMEVILIGETTEGKNVGSFTYESKDKVWEMHPITCQIFNTKGESDYDKGFNPDYPKGDAFDYNEEGYVVYIPVLYDLGHEDERLLKIALGLIDGTYTGDQETRSLRTPVSVEKVMNSLDRKATNGVVIDRKQ